MIPEKPCLTGTATRESVQGTHCRGSVVIVVLWVLMLISFLAAQHAGHNRAKAGLAGGAWERIQREHAVQSIAELFSTGNWPIPGAEEDQGKWFVMEWSGFSLWCRVDEEGNRVLINQIAEPDLRERIRMVLARHGDENRTDWITDAILDWMDEDSLVRGEGAEDAEYLREGLRYGPANGPFKVFSEILMVRGMAASLFWGDPFGSMTIDLKNQNENVVKNSQPFGNAGRTGGLGLEADESVPDFWDLFTVYPKGVKRLTCLIPGTGGSYQMALVFFGPSGNQGTYRILEKHQISFISDGLAAGLDPRTWKRGLDSDPVSIYIPVSMLR